MVGRRGASGRAVSSARIRNEILLNMNMTWLVVSPAGLGLRFVTIGGGIEAGENGRGGSAGFASGFCETNPATGRAGFAKRTLRAGR